MNDSTKTEINPGDFINTEAAAKIIGQSPGTLATWRHYGKGPRFCKFGRSVRYYKPDLLEYALDTRRESTSQTLESA
jgi:hypothetical protein